MRSSFPSKQLSRSMFALFVSLVLTLIIRLSWFNSIGYDEGIYLLISRLLAEGTQIYRDIPVHKPPMIFIINAALTGLGGNLLVARLAIIAISVLSSFLIFLITFSLIQDFKVSLLACMLFSIFTSFPLSEIFFVLTEPYVIFFELLALYFLIRAKVTGDARNLLFSGFSGSCALLTRQTAAVFLVLFFSLFLIWKIRGYFLGKRAFLYGLLGAAIPILLVVVPFGYLGSLYPMIYQNTIWAYSDASAVFNLTNLRQLWFFGFFVSSSPLWFLGALVLLRRRDSTRAARNYDTVFFLFLWAIGIVAFYKLLLGPGYYHEYSETLAPLSVLSSMGADSRSWVKSAGKTFSRFRGIKISPGVKISLTVGLLVFLSYNSLNYNLTMGEVFTDDYTMIREVSDYLRKNTQISDRLLVFETQVAKIGPLIYFESDRNPIWLERGFNSLGVTAEERDRLLELLKDSQNVKVVIVGGRPPSVYQNGEIVYDFIANNYVIEKEFGLYTPYPGRIGNLPVMLLRAIRSVNFVNEQKFNLSNIRGATYRIENDTLFLSDKYFPGYTLFYPLAVPTDFSSSIFNVQLKGKNETNTSYLDLIDENGNLVRHRITYFSDWVDVRVPVDPLTFVSPGSSKPADLHRIVQINLILKADSEVDLSIRQMSLLRMTWQD
jgi:hypothetical protein